MHNNNSETSEVFHDTSSELVETNDWVHNDAPSSTAATTTNAANLVVQENAEMGKITIKVEEATVSLVHARSPYVHRRALWDELTTLGINVGAWVVASDFNVVTMATERKGGRSPCQLAVNEFIKFINNNALLDSINLGYKFSWCNKRLGDKRMLQKIDRILVNQQWIDIAAGWKSKILTRKFSDHLPVVGWLTTIPKTHKHSFQVQEDLDQT
ncbi:hypothetical protein IFM89_003601 [Coptis chinensis]|uniref:Endonuclease/exonuclease/phosphatase domain-containing protein n=1 Tax=Coptis chinensis TaxID=261450 RepID=A0A835LWT9_9MAGN|nr:hypothetical protein IFM89_003601 [Coptis chinensis]